MAVKTEANQGNTRPVYLDNNATTKMDPRVLEAMMPYLTDEFGNPGSRNHAYGWNAEAAVEKSRKQIAAVLGCSDKEVVFTSGATESNNIAILGVAEMYREKGNHIITCVTEHKAVLDPCKYLETKGFKVTYLPVDQQGVVDLKALEAAMTDQTILVTIMHANNEVGTIQPIAEISRIVKSKGALLHVDGAQAFGKIPTNMEELGIDLYSVSGHKVYGPKGIGALYVRRKNPRVRLAAIVHGGGQERGIRSGTLNTPAIVGLGVAAEIAHHEMAAEAARLVKLRERLYKGLTEELDEIFLNGHPEKRLPNNLNVSFAFVEGEGLMMGISDIAVSSGSACTSASLEPSYVLKALGVGEELAHTSIRFGLGRFTTEEEVDYAANRVVGVVKKLREMSPLYEMAKEGVDLKSVSWIHH